MERKRIPSEGKKIIVAYLDEFLAATFINSLIGVMK